MLKVWERLKGKKWVCNETLLNMSDSLGVSNVIGLQVYRLEL